MERNRPRCPGQDMRFWKPGDIFTVACPQCGGEIEFFKDEPVRPCPSCKAEVRNPKIDLGCAKWCKHAEQCLGPADDSGLVQPIWDRLAAAVEVVFGHNAEGFQFGKMALQFARQILETERANPLIVQAAALVHELAGHARSAECQPFDPNQRRKSPDAAVGGPDLCQTRTVLERVGIGPDDIGRICRTVWSIQSGLEEDTPEFRVAWDAIQLTRMKAEKLAQPAALDATFRTGAGRELARELVKARST